MKRTFSFHITGKVQGVWYRASAKDKAMSLGLKGEVWNEPDGAVGATIQGEIEQVEAFKAWCYEGPPLARVDRVEVNEVETVEVFGEFVIKRT